MSEIPRSRFHTNCQMVITELEVYMTRAFIMLLGFSLITGCDQMGGGKGDSGGMGSQSDRDFQRGSGAAQQGPNDPNYRSGQSVSEGGSSTNQNNPGSPSGGTAGWPERKENQAAPRQQEPTR
jgi:hypothetical protein